jgi:CRP-like cAMP-binding protein
MKSGPLNWKNMTHGMCPWVSLDVSLILSLLKRFYHHHFRHNMDLENKISLFRDAIGFEGLKDPQIREVGKLAFVRRFSKGQTVFNENDVCRYFHLVARGLIKVSLVSYGGHRITYLLAGSGEPLNLVGPFAGTPRPLHAEAMEDSMVAHIKRDDFTSFCHRNPTVMHNIIITLGHAVDSANCRILDMMEMRVEQRLLKVLLTLYRKFGKTLDFKGNELAEMAGTTTESTLRVMARLRQSGIIQTRRGQIQILKAEDLEHVGSGSMWL